MSFLADLPSRDAHNFARHTSKKDRSNHSQMRVQLECPEGNGEKRILSSKKSLLIQYLQRDLQKQASISSSNAPSTSTGTSSSSHHPTVGLVPAPPPATPTTAIGPLFKRKMPNERGAATTTQRGTAGPSSSSSAASSQRVSDDVQPRSKAPRLNRRTEGEDDDVNDDEGEEGPSTSM